MYMRHIVKDPAIQIAGGIDAALARGVAHRNIKPSNIPFTCACFGLIPTDCAGTAQWFHPPLAEVSTLLFVAILQS